MLSLRKFKHFLWMVIGVQLITLLPIRGFSAEETLKDKMNNFFKQLEVLQPYLVNSKKYFDDKNADEIKKALIELQKNAQHMKAQPEQMKDFQIRFQQLNEGVGEAVTTFNDGFKDYSYWVLKSTLHNCSSCHTQKSLPETHRQFTFDADVEKANQADFLFTVRNYKEAIPLYMDILKQYPKNKATLQDVELAVHRLGYYFIRVIKNDDETLKTFKELVQLKELPLFLQQDLKAWIGYLQIKKYRIFPEFSSQVTLKELKEFVNQREQIADHYRKSSQRFVVDQETLYYLYQLLDQNTSQDVKNWSQYFAAKLQRNYRDNLFDMTSELYLKDCLQNKSDKELKKLCLQELKNIKIEKFNVSDFDKLPTKIKQEVKDLEAK